MFRKLVGLSLGIVGAVLMSMAAVTAQGPEPRSPRAVIGTAFTYQGTLKQGGAAVNGPVSLSFKLYSTNSGGAPLGTLSQVVTPTSGMFTARLDFGNLFNGEERWLGIAIGADPELTPRQALSAVPYALYATGNWGLAGNGGTAPAANFVGTTDAQPLVFRTNNAEVMRLSTGGALGIGTSSPSDKLTVADGNARIVQAQFATEGFEALAFPPPGWTTGGNVSWSRVSSTFYEGTAATASGAVSANQSSYLEYDYTFPQAGVVRFRWKVDSEAGYDYLLFCLDNNACTRTSGFNQRISGSVDWTEVSVPVAAGAHTMRWVYWKDDIVNVGSDKGWLDAVRLTGTSGNLTVENKLDVTYRASVGELAVGGASILSGRVGVGVATPLQLVHMKVLTGDGEGLRIDSPIAGHAPAVYLNHSGPSGRNYRIASYGDNETAGSFRIRDETGNADRFIIDNAGRVGINTAYISRTLELNGVLGVYDAGARSRFGGIATEAGASLIDFGMNEDATNRFGGAYVQNDQGGLLRVDTRSGGNLFQFLARPAQSNALVSEVMGISSAGRVGIGVAVPAYRLELPNIASVDGQARANAWQTYSSRRYKTNVVTLDGALDKVLRLRGVAFDWQSNGKRDIGLIAEEVGQVFPEIVSYEPNGVDAQSLDYSRLVAVLVEATKEQQRQIERQGEEMAALKGQNASLATRLEALERQATAGGVSPHASAAWADFAGLLNSGNVSLLGLLGMGIYLARRRK